MDSELCSTPIQDVDSWIAIYNRYEKLTSEDLESKVFRMSLKTGVSTRRVVLDGIDDSDQLVIGVVQRVETRLVAARTPFALK